MLWQLRFWAAYQGVGIFFSHMLVDSLVEFLEYSLLASLCAYFCLTDCNFSVVGVSVYDV